MNILKQLDEGSYGTVYLVQYDDKQIVAKVANLRKLDLKSPVTLTLIEKEVTALRELSNSSAKEYVPTFIDSYYQVYKELPHHFILMEYINGEQLVSYTNNWEGDIPVDILHHLTNGLINGLCEIHYNGFTHGDVKPENILVTEQGAIKYVDFGFSCNARNVDPTHKSKRGTLMYDPPEFFQEYPFTNSLQKAQAHDVWSLGIVIYELAHGLDKVPYDIKAVQVQQEIAIAPYIPPNYTRDDGSINKFLIFWLINDWKNRPTIHDIKEVFNKEIVKEKI